MGIAVVHPAAVLSSPMREAGCTAAVLSHGMGGQAIGHPAAVVAYRGGRLAVGRPGWRTSSDRCRLQGQSGVLHFRYTKVFSYSVFHSKICRASGEAILGTLKYFPIAFSTVIFFAPTARRF